MGQKILDADAAAIEHTEKALDLTSYLDLSKAVFKVMDPTGGTFNHLAVENNFQMAETRAHKATVVDDEGAVPEEAEPLMDNVAAISEEELDPNLPQVRLRCNYSNLSIFSLNLFSGLFELG